MKKNILLVIVTAIICVGVTAFAYTYNASDVGYKNTNVSDALDDLYNLADKDLTFGTALYSQNFGDASSTASSNITLTKGKYLVLAIFGLGSGHTTSSYSNVSDANVALECSNCRKTKLSGRYYDASASRALTGTSVYSYGIIRSTLYYVEIDNDSDTLNTSWSGLTNSEYISEIALLQAIPLDY